MRKSIFNVLFISAILLLNCILCQAQLRSEAVEKAYLNLEAGDFTKALQFANTALDLTIQEFGKESEAYSKTMDLFGAIYFNQSNFTEALKFYSASKELKEKIIGDSSPSYAKTLNNLSLCLRKLGRLKEVEPLLIEAIRIKKNAYGDADTSLAVSLHNLGDLYIELADYEKAEKIYIQALEIKKKSLGDENVSTAKSYQNLGTLYAKLSNFSTSKVYLQKAYKVFLSAYGDNNIETAKTRFQLAAVCTKTDDIDLADELFEKSQNIIQQLKNSSPLDYAQTLVNMSYLEWERKNYNKCEELLLEAYNILQNKPSNPIFADCMNLLGMVYYNNDNFDKAYQYATNAVQLRNDLYGDSHPEYASSLHTLAGIEKSMKLYNKAEDDYRKAFSIYLNQIYNYFPFLSENEKMQFYFNLRERFDLFNCYVVERYRDNHNLASDMLNLRLATKAILLNTTKQIRNSIQKSGDSLFVNKFDQWRALRESLSKCCRLSPQELKQSVENINHTDSLANALEKELSQFSSKFQSSNKYRNYTWKDVQKALSKDEAAVEIIRFNFYEKGWTDTVFYAYLIITSETTKQPELILVSNGKYLEHSAANIYNNNIRHWLNDTMPYINYWVKVESIIKDKKTIYVSLDGIYNNININTLLRPDGTYILDDKNIVITTNLLDIINTKNYNTNLKNINNTSQNIVLFGYPKFTCNKIDEKTSLNQPYIKINDLPGTAEEVDKINSIFVEHKNHPKVFLGSDASVANMKALVSPNIIHIATHGYFEKDVEIKNSDQLAKAITNEDWSNNPLFRSYLLFSCAEQALNNMTDVQLRENSILSAYNVMNLSFDSTALVVLSACETGLGELKNGEGVYGLQRAFQVAGAESVIMSLWTVNDQTTQELMVEFYRNWLSGQPIGVAFRDAQLKIKVKHSEPYYWGAFILIGNYK